LCPESELSAASLILEVRQRWIARSSLVVPSGPLRHEFPIDVEPIDIHPGDPPARTILAVINYLHGLSEDVVGQRFPRSGSVVLTELRRVDFSETHFLLAARFIKTGHQVTIDHPHHTPTVSGRSRRSGRWR
jgi:hypothetical protein